MSRLEKGINMSKKTPKIEGRGDPILDQLHLFTGKTLREELTERMPGRGYDLTLCPYCHKQLRHRQDSITWPCCNKNECRKAYRELCVLCRKRPRVDQFICDDYACIEVYRN